MLTILISLFATADGQSQGSCILQRGFGTKSDAFSAQQQQCIQAYVEDVRRVLPHYDLSTRRFGGASSQGPAPVLGAGFGTTATRSLKVFAQQLGLKVHHFDQSSDPLWALLDDSLTADCSSRAQTLNRANFQGLLQGHDLLLDTPIGELFLDFYAASPNSKVILTKRDPKEWALARKQFKLGMAIPVQSPCGASLDDISYEDAAFLFGKHDTLVRCVVPPEKLLEFSVFDGSADTTRIATFLGLPAPAYHVPFPRVGGKKMKRFSRSPLERAMEVSRPQISMCITGQIRRLELHSKVNRLIKPAMAAGYRVEVFLVIDPRGDTTYIHRPAGARTEDNFTIVEGPFRSLDDTVNVFPPNVSVIFDPFIPRDYKIDPSYAEGMSADGRLEDALLRARSHVRQWEAMKRCWELMSSCSPSLDVPSFAMRLRDDDAVLANMVFPDLAPGVHVPDCGDCHGLNDKFAVVSGTGAIEHYFTGPLLFMQQSFEQLMGLQRQRTNYSLNPESVLKNSLLLGHIAVHKLNPYSAPIVPAKFVTDGQKVYSCYFRGANFEPCISQDIWDRVASKSIYNASDEPVYVCEDAPESMQMLPT